MSVFSFRLFDHWSQGPAADRLGSALFHFVWQGVAIAAMAWMVVQLLRGARPQVRYGLLVLALGAMCVCPVVTFVVSRPKIGESATAARRGQAVHIMEIDLAATMMGRSSAFEREEPETKAAAAEVSVDETATTISESPTTRQQPVEPASVATRTIALNAWLTAAKGWLDRHRHEFVFAWGCGVLLLTLRLATGLFGAERVRRRHVVTARESLQQMTARLIARMGIHRPVCVQESALAEVPTLVGWLRPVILLPATAICGLTPTQLESLLAHELAHVRRHDYLVNLWQTVVETILFYHPAVWWISRRIREEREHCCDEVAVALCGDRLAYARALATMEEIRAPVPRWAVAAGSGALAGRIRRIVGMPEATANRRPAAGALVVLALLAVSTAATTTLRQDVSANEPNAGGESRREDTAISPVADESNAAAATVLRAVLDHNRPWLDRGASGAGWRPPFKTLSYSYHRPLEGDREQIVLNSNGEAVLEVMREANARNRDRLGDRFIALSSGGHAVAKRGGSLAWIRARPEPPDSVIARYQTFDHSLQQCARLGTQFDLPLFHWEQYVDTSRLDVSDGEWRGVSCQVLTAPFPNPNFRVGSESPHDDRAWGHRSPDKEVFYIDPQRHVVLHETLIRRMQFDPDLHYEIDFLDYVEVVPGQWAPLEIHVVLPEFFTARYQFQIVGKTHWMLKEVTSWYEFDRERSRGVVENILIDGDASILDESLKQVAATRQAPASEVQEAIAVLNGPERRDIPHGDVIRLKRTRPDREGRFTVTFENPQDASDTRRWILDPAIHQAVVQLVVYDHKFGRAEEKMLQLPARAEGGYHVDLRMDADLIDTSHLSIWFVTKQPDQDAFVKRFIEEGKGGKYRGLLRTSGARLSDMPINEAVTGWIVGDSSVRWELDESRVAAKHEVSEVPGREKAGVDPKKPWAVHGRVTGVDGQPMEGVTVTASTGIGTLFTAGTATSGADGKYALEFGQGVWLAKDKAALQAATIVARKGGYSEANLSRHGDLVAAMELPEGEIHWGKKTKADLLLPGKPRQVDFRMVAATDVSGRLVDERKSPLTAYSVSLRGEALPPSSSVLASTRTDRDGRFVLKDVPAGFDWQFLIESANKQPPWNGWASGAFRFKREPGKPELLIQHGSSVLATRQFEVQIAGDGIPSKEAVEKWAAQQTLQVEPIAGDQGAFHVCLILDPSGKAGSSGEAPAESAAPRTAKSENPIVAQLTERLNFRRTRPDAGGRFTITFENPLLKGETERMALDPEKNQVIFQVFVRADRSRPQKIFRQIGALQSGTYRVNVQVKPELIPHSQLSITFVTIQPDHDEWVKRFFHEGKGTSYKGMWSSNAAQLKDVPLDKEQIGWLADGENPAAPAVEATTATASNESNAEKSPTAAEILQMVVDKNRFWLDPQPKNLSYTVVGGKPGAEGARQTTNRVRISGDKVRWDLDTEFEPPPNSKRKSEPMNYTYVFTPDGTICVRAPPKVDKDVLSRKRGTHALRQGMLFSTALHVMALHGIPKTCRIVEEKPGADGRVVVIEGEFRNARGAFGLGMDHVQLGKIDWRIDQFRVHVRLRDAAPIKEEYFDPTTGALMAMSVEFGPETLKIGDHVAPATARFMSSRDVPAGRAGGFKKWILEARFQNVEGNWLLEKATNSQDGVVVKQLQVTEISTAPVPPEVFDPPQPAVEEKKENEKGE